MPTAACSASKPIRRPWSPDAAASGKNASPRNEVLSLDEVTRTHIEMVLALTQGRIEGRRGAAALLKINPHTLRARMRKLGIDWLQFRVKSILGFFGDGHAVNNPG
jgi:transcriptional regulator with GAF, ATPase, and Fis domain